MNDFTLGYYSEFLSNLIKKNYIVLTLKDYLIDPDYNLNITDKKYPNSNILVLQHDVDRRPKNSLKKARLEHKLGIHSTYNFRTIPKTFQPKIIAEIADMGHEIGYHYENLTTTNGDYQQAIKDFEKNLARLRQYYPVKTICMHGSPLSQWDNRLLWQKYDYHDYGILGEPYFDLDYDNVFYITDAARSWNNGNVSVRDKVDSNHNITINHTDDIINLIQSDKAPSTIRLNTHPEHWAATRTEWLRIYLIRLIKNTAKRLLIYLRPMSGGRKPETGNGKPEKNR